MIFKVNLLTIVDRTNVNLIDSRLNKRIGRLHHGPPDTALLNITDRKNTLGIGIDDHTIESVLLKRVDHYFVF